MKLVAAIRQRGGARKPRPVLDRVLQQHPDLLEQRGRTLHPPEKSTTITKKGLFVLKSRKMQLSRREDQVQGLIISADSSLMDPATVIIVQEWSV